MDIKRSEPLHSRDNTVKTVFLPKYHPPGLVLPNAYIAVNVHYLSVLRIPLSLFLNYSLLETDGSNSTIILSELET